MRRAVGESNTLLDVALEAVDGLAEEPLLLVGNVAEDIDGLLGSVGLDDIMLIVLLFLAYLLSVGTYTKLNGDREEINTSLLSDLGTSWDARQVDVARLHKTLATSNSLEQLIGEPV